MRAFETGRIRQPLMLSVVRALLGVVSLWLATIPLALGAVSQSALSADTASATSATTADVANRFAVTLKMPLILPGIGIDVTAALNKYLAARVGYSYLPYTYHKSGTLSESDGGFGYTGQSEVRAWNLLLDYKPWGGTFKITAGIYGPAAGIKVTGSPTQAGNLTINGNTYDSSEVRNLRGKVGWYSVAPYFGLGRDGFNNATAEHPVYFSFDVGVISAKPKGRLNYSCTATTNICTQLASDVTAQKNKLSATIGSFSLLPLVQIGVGYRF